MKTDYKRTPEPNYYVGTTYGYSARRVVEDYELTYNVGTAVSYLLRAGKKEGNPAQQDIQKAINHLHFELDRLYVERDINTGALAE
tara:strand:+ start:989 stop:1246 length:258 start_codon:yes stop_codon:yes gene_type:complete